MRYARCIVIGQDEALLSGKRKGLIERMGGKVAVAKAGHWALAGILGASTMASSVGGMIMGYPAMNMMAQQDAFMMMGVLGIGFVMILMIGIIAIVSLRSKGHREANTDIEAMLLESAIMSKGQQNNAGRSRRTKSRRKY